MREKHTEPTISYVGHYTVRLTVSFCRTDQRQQHDIALLTTGADPEGVAGGGLNGCAWAEAP